MGKSKSKKLKLFKEEFTFDERKKESTSIIVKYPDRVPVIIEKYARADIPTLDKKKTMLQPPREFGPQLPPSNYPLPENPGESVDGLDKAKYKER
ncbi:hypothetical protein Ahy_A01g000517 [Arachis hypogaea]|uniref:Autophagy-related protein n=1 Tax=Arachis hypogaea TaxID=3818 RepID=A0A445EKC8_ARAHY|nr:hypothetical protein Ahy_A01g000517 [Arachis hypogaea]